MARSLAAALIVCLAGCGGSGDPSAAAPTPQVQIDHATQSYSALYIEQAPITVTLDPSALTFLNFPSTPVVTVNAPASAGIQSATFAMSDATHGGITFTFAAPVSVTPGTHTTTVAVQVCADAACSTPVTGGSLTLTVDFTVTDTLASATAPGYQISAYPYAATLLAANGRQNTLFIVTPTPPSGSSASVEPIDATTGQATHAPLSLASAPDTLALSDDGTQLYLSQPNAIRQIDTASWTATASIAASGGNVSIAVQPGHPETIAVGAASTLQIFDAGVRRANDFGGSDFFSGVGWTGDPAVLSADVRASTLDNNECTIGVDSAGVSDAGQQCVSARYPGSSNLNSSFTFVNGLGYGTAGAVLDVASWTYTGALTYGGASPQQVFADGTVGKAFGIASTSDLHCHLLTFALSSQALLADIALPNVIPVAASADPCSKYAQLTRWGAQGLALSTGTDVVIVSAAFVDQ